MSTFGLPRLPALKKKYITNIFETKLRHIIYITLEIMKIVMVPSEGKKRLRILRHMSHTVPIKKKEANGFVIPCL